MTEQPATFGTELRRRRMAAGLSLAVFARQVHYSKGYLGKIETGDKSPGADLARRCDAVLGAGGQLVALFVRDQSREQAQSPMAEAKQDGEVWVMSMEPDGTSRLIPMRRRDAFAVGASSLLGVSLGTQSMSAAAPQDGTIAAFRSLFEQTRQLGQIAGPGVVLPTVIAQTHTLRGMAGTASPAARGELLRLAARYAEYAGWMTQEAGDDRGSLWWTRAAVDLATAAGDTQLATFALIRQALITLYRDDAAGTIDLAQQAQADPRTPPRIRGLAALREAQGHALACDPDQCQRALDRAEELLARAREDADDTADGLKLGSASVSGPGLHAMVAGWCLHDLGRCEQAGELLDQQLALVPETARRVRARFGARRALAYATAGEVDHACALAHQTLSSAEAVDSATIRVDLRRLARALVRWHTHQPVRELYPRLNETLRTSIT
ncbi:transcriptional regulator with XRE-family HTH domain/tetratricopeptide (TPR) repeat protein [Kibdelosporangium banguiense]|uniref:Transcriptional regulator with XRE-family HTH domain/tetratricopeptide (TPR) repeat protein n=1 Tax=Kibdelosporangium banguiense TaxID=1365924 RepID=A0ABS4TQQ8_9PSEU|nr:helix-turn-helix transcriptional regulator [Kibdelosporangium banguiense]MBP2326742.1 transcriptional regulator with XRE-family HTH domain/tetratricopeptide (TPR) repeat protein [Kibdelosporangium banguiense]